MYIVFYSLFVILCWSLNIFNAIDVIDTKVITSGQQLYYKKEINP